MGEHGVVADVAPAHLGAAHRIDRPGRVGPQRRLTAREVADRTEQRERQLGAVADDLVLEQPVVQEREPGGTVGRVDEPAGHEGGESVLELAAFGGEAARHDRERALGVGAAHRRGEREVRAQTMVVARVLELGVHAQESLTRPQLEGGAHRDRDPLVAARAARAFVALRALRQGVGGVDRDPGPHRARFDHLDRDGVRFGDLDVGRGG